MYLSLILPSLIIFRSCDRSVRSWEVPLTVADNWLNVLNKGVTCSLGSRRRELLEKLRWNPGQSADKRIKIISAPGQNNIQIVTHTLQWFNLIFPYRAFLSGVMMMKYSRYFLPFSSSNDEDDARCLSDWAPAQGIGAIREGQYSFQAAQSNLPSCWGWFLRW